MREGLVFIKRHAEHQIRILGFTIEDRLQHYEAVSLYMRKHSVTVLRAKLHTVATLHRLLDPQVSPILAIRLLLIIRMTHMNSVRIQHNLYLTLDTE